MTTLITDDFDGDATPKGDSVHHIVYGAHRRWTDALDTATIDVLVSAGVIVLHRVVEHPAGETRLWRSVEGRVV